MKQLGGVHRIGAYVYLAAVLTQFFFAGLGLFGAASFAPHGILGSLLVPYSLLLLLVAFAARRAPGPTAVLFVFTLVQMMLVWASDAAPVISALHPVNALWLLFLGSAVARGATLSTLVPGRDASGAEPATAPRVR